MSASVAAAERPPNKVFKSGPLFISSKGLGWKSWKKRWFILTRTSLVFFKSDPNALPQRSGEVNLTLGGIDLNNSGSVVVREDKKLLTVLFPDGRDGRAFTLKAETEEELFEWKTALEDALAQAPSAALVMGHSGIFRTDTNDTLEGSFSKWRDKPLVKSLVIGRPILLALEDIDGNPSFLEKALQFLEKYGTKVEGILRQSADVEEVERRVQEYEQGKNEFSPDEDAHVVGDCVKHVLRELPSSPVPASCCTALLEAYKIDCKEARVSAMRSAILETFPEPNRRLFQRILKMMHTISLHSQENRMNASAVAACMAPLLLRPLLAGECELDDEFDSTDDSSAQLLAAANAANNAHAIVTALLEEYANVFDDENLQRHSLSSDSGTGNSESEDLTDDENLDLKDNGFHDAQNELGPEIDDDIGRVSSGKLSESSGYAGNDLYEFKECGGAGDSDVGSPRYIRALSPSSNILVNLHSHGKEQVNKKEGNGDSVTWMETPSVSDAGKAYRSTGVNLTSVDQGQSVVSSSQKSMNKASNISTKQLALWGRSMARKTLSTDSTDSSGEEELAIQRLEITKNELQQRIAKEARGNAILQASLERRKQALHERRLALEQDVARLQEQLQAERDLRAALEVGLTMSSGQLSSSRGIDSKTRSELEEIALAEADVARLKEKVAELHHQLKQQQQHHTPISGASAAYEQGQISSQKRVLLQDFDATISSYNHERKQRTVESLLVGDSRNTKGQSSVSGSKGRQPSHKHFDSTGSSNFRSSEPSASICTDEFYAINSASVPSSSAAAEVLDHPRHPSATSSALVELTTRLDFFKERRSQLMEQLHKLDLNFSASSKDLA